MAKKQKQTIIKKPVGNGNISITIENNLKNTNPAPPPQPKKRRRRRQPTDDSVTTDGTNSKIEDMLRGGGGGGSATGGGLPQIKDVSYIKPPSDRFTVWRNYMNDSFNTTTPIQTTTQAIPEGQARQMGYLPPVPLALPAPPPPPPAPPPPRPPPVLPALGNALPQMFLQYMAQQEDRNRDRENTLIQMFQNNRNNENMGFNSDGRINELPEEDEEQINQDLRNEGVTQEQLDFLELQKLKNKIKTDRGLGTKDANNNKDIRLGYQNNEYYMSSYNKAKAKANSQAASKPTTRSDTAGAAAGARPTTPPRPIPPGRSPGRGNRLTQEEREAGTAIISTLERELANATSLQQAFESFGRGL